MDGVRGTIAVNMATGTIISTLSGAPIDPASIGISTATIADQTRADVYIAKKTKPIKSKT